ncbi:MAG: class I mannose-6-phosphate isomerase [Thermomicrobiales bacterium]|nr:class I mannose-6-phosphate isomerase [Thermomicrobiales bacterium]
MGSCDVSIVSPRLDTKPWGGRKLTRFGLPLPEGEAIGEALVTADDAVITAGVGVGRTLGDLVQEAPDIRLGADAAAAVSGKHIFPLLVKLIDAAENLSIQVHPDDVLAQPLNKLGKTEAWHILASEGEGSIYIGLKQDVDTALFMEHAHLLDGTSAADLRKVQAISGETFLIPAGTVHALGAGVMVYEIQQPSDVTFRLDDWGRVDAQGNPREMHLEQGEIALRPALRPREIPGIRLDVEGSRTLLTACRYFALERLELAEMTSVLIGQATTPNVVTVLAGQLTLSGHALVAGESAVIWPGDEPVACTANADTIALRSWVPNLQRDVIAPARDAGAGESDIAALGGMTGDVAAALTGS